mmetsp:Transcript_6578/g.18525  ORF Transcript_6578/g.18525 Transcript_6578/m.18525 type:complete len:350 (+) Transcript_6578:91-1140(+)
MFYKTTRLAQPGTHTTSRKRPCSSNHNARQRIHADLCGSASSSSRWLPSGPQQGGHSLFDSLHDKIPRRLEGLERIVSMRHHARLVPQHDTSSDPQHEPAASLALLVDDDLRGHGVGESLGECLLYLHHDAFEVWSDGELEYYRLLAQCHVATIHDGRGLGSCGAWTRGPLLRLGLRHPVGLAPPAAHAVLAVGEAGVHPLDKLCGVDLPRAVLVDDVEEVAGLPGRQVGLGAEPRDEGPELALVELAVPVGVDPPEIIHHLGWVHVAKTFSQAAAVGSVHLEDPAEELLAVNLPAPVHVDAVEHLVAEVPVHWVGVHAVHQEVELVLVHQAITILVEDLPVVHDLPVV